MLPRRCLHAGVPTSTTVDVVVAVIDANNPPSYTGDAVLYVDENSPVGTLICQLPYIDPNIGDYSRYISYRSTNTFGTVII